RHLWTVRSRARSRNRPHGLVVLVILAILGLLAVLAARVDAQPVVDPDDPPAGATPADPDEPAPDEDPRPFPYVPRPHARDLASAPAISGVLAAAYRTAELDLDPGPSWRMRTRLAGLVPMVSVRGGQDASWRDITDPTIGYVSVFTVTATWHLDRLLFDP